MLIIALVMKVPYKGVGVGCTHSVLRAYLQNGMGPNSGIVEMSSVSSTTDEQHYADFFRKYTPPLLLPGSPMLFLIHFLVIIV